MPNITQFDAAYYLQNNLDVLSQVTMGFFTSAQDHFIRFGARELRNPNALFDVKYYATNNPDVLAAVSAGFYSSVYDHYLRFGLSEGRSPNAALKGFDGATYLAANPDVAAAGFTAATALQHYLRYGNTENRAAPSSTSGVVTGNIAGTNGDDAIAPAGSQSGAIRVEGGQQAAAGDTLVITSGSGASFQVVDLSVNTGDQNQTRDSSGAKIGPTVQGFENIDGRQATLNLSLTAIDRTSVGNSGGVAAAQTGSVVYGGGGRDTLAGNAGADSLIGNDGNDSMTGAAGNDSLAGGSGDDVLRGGTGNDSLTDGAGNDIVTGDAGADVMTVDSGANSIDGGADNDRITLIADQNGSLLQGGSGDDTIILDAEAISSESRANVTGDAGNDTIIASQGAETISGGEGNDTIRVSQTSLGARDVLDGGAGVHDILQFDVASGASGSNTATFLPSAASRISGFEALALVDTSGDTRPKQYKITLTDAFVAQNITNGAFLLDARGLPGGSNVILDFSQLTAASAGRFGVGSFRVLASPSTDIRDQNNATISNRYAVNTSNAALSAVQAFQVYVGETTITAGTDAAYGVDRTIATGSGQQAYVIPTSIILPTPDTSGDGSTPVTAAAITLTASPNQVTSSVATGTASSTTFLNTLNDTITGGAFLASTSQIVDPSTTDSDRLTYTTATGTIAPTITNIEALIIQAAAATSTLDATNVTGLTSIEVSSTGTLTVNNLAQTVQSFSLTGTGGAALTAQYAGSDTNNFTGTLTLSGGTIDTSTFTSSGNDIDQLAIVSSGATANAVTLGNAQNEVTGGVAETITITGTAALTLASTAANLGTTTSGVSSTITASNTGGTTVNFTDTTGFTAGVSGYTGITSYTLNQTAGGGVTLTGLNGTSSTVTMAGSNHGTIDLSATTAGYTANLTDTNNAPDTYGISLSGNIPTVNLTVGTGADTISFQTTSGVGSGETLNILGPTSGTAANLSLSIGATASGTALVLNGGTYAGDLTISTTSTAVGINVTGGSGNDLISGSSVADTLRGGAGADTITASGGADILTGGAGADVFRFAAGVSTLSNLMTITDFRAAGGANAGAADLIELTGQVSVVNNFTANIGNGSNLATVLGVFANGNTLDNGLTCFVVTISGISYDVIYVETVGAGTTYVATDTVILIQGAPFTSGAIAGHGFDGL